MYHIGFRSEIPAIQRLIDDYNAAESAADPDRLLSILRKAKRAVKAYRKAAFKQQLLTIAAMCQMALAELDLQEAVNYIGRPDVLSSAQHMLGYLTA